MLTLYLRQPARLNAQHWFVTITPGGTVFQLGPQQVSFAGDIVLTFPNANRFMGTFNRAVQWQTTGVIVEIHGMASGAPERGPIVVWVRVPYSSLYRARDLCLKWSQTLRRPVGQDNFSLNLLGTPCITLPNILKYAYV